MGCLFSLIPDLFETLYISLMCMIIPKWKLSEKAVLVLEFIVEIFSILLLIAMVIGIILLFNEEPFLVEVGRKMIFIPLCIIAVQIAFGVIVKLIARKK